LFLVAEGLVEFDSKMHVRPALASSWKVLPDQKTWEFKLRPNVSFQDGTPFDAQAVETNYKRMLDPKIDATGQATWTPFASVQAIDKQTVRIATKAPFASTLQYLAHFSATIMSPRALQGSNIQLHPVGTGPYAVTSFQPGVTVNLARNDKWWRGKAGLSTITLRAVANAQARVSALQAGQAQLIDNVAATDRPTLKANNNLQVVSTPTWVTTWLMLNTASGPFKDVNLRKGLAYAIDVKSIISAIFRGQADALDSPLASNMPGYSKVASATYDPARAQAAFKQAGYAMSGGKLMKNGQPLSLTFSAPTGLYPNDTAVAQAIQAGLQKLGMEVKLNTQPASAWFTYIRDAKPENTN
ncbi:MAG: ABC transporter substrate-binding protein, partial [Chloroflexota bacterium]